MGVGASLPLRYDLRSLIALRTKAARLAKRVARDGAFRKWGPHLFPGPVCVFWDFATPAGFYIYAEFDAPETN